MSCNHRTYDKTNRYLKKLPRLLTSYQRARKDTNERIDFKELPEETPDYPIIRIFLHGDDSAVYAPRLIAIETNERKMTGFADTTDSCFVSSNAAVLQITHFAYLEESTTKRMSNIAIPKYAKKNERLEETEGRATCNENENNFNLGEAVVLVKSGGNLYHWE